MYIESPPPFPASMTASPEAEALPQLWQRLAEQDWPVRTVEAELPELLRQASSLAADWRWRWLDGLHCMWQRHGWALSLESQHTLLQLAAAWCDWPLAQAVGEALREREALREEAALTLLNACRQLGQPQTAIDIALGLQLAKPHNADFATLYRELQNWRHWRDQLDEVDGQDWGDAELRLEPLAPHHLPDFAWQYYDPAIAELCCLPKFASDAQWSAWLGGIYQAGDQRIYAVLHRSWGCVGCVSLIQYRDIGFFYYWIGRDFQGQGLGPRAVELMLAMAAERYGLRTCYAKVYDDNTPSRRALEKLGFADIVVSAVAPDEREMFYRRGLPATRQQIAAELHWLMAAIDSSTVPAILLLPADVTTTASRHG
jgi:RimJ/RimL family protein N-acetyltransferase